VQTVTDREQRLTALLDAVASDVRRYLIRRAGEQAADEVLAEVSVVLWRRLDDVPTDEPLPWAYGVARRCLANHLRSEKRRLRLVDRLGKERPTPTPGTSPAEEALHEALRTLKADDRDVLELWAWEGLEPRHIATTLGISANAAAIRLHRAKKRLAEAFDSAERARALADTGADERRAR
jgi:RNA polymerase sigma-70 factor (ECF subfamily)